MVKVKALQETASRWARRMAETPALPCWQCKRKTRAWWGKGICQYCGARLPYPSK
ncbi:MAG: hypothetical protein KAW83_01755 [Dehalococcoidia bacterium]|nr:hypothetical protein [Dehalococcoidia bacterium]